MNSSTIAIMQPTYLPWIGYLDLIDRSDRFVFLDSVQFSSRSWQQRNRIKGVREILLLTVPVLSKGREHQRICEVEIDQSQNFQEKHLRTIVHHYSKAPFFSQYIEGFSKILRRSHRFLADLNIELIDWFCTQLGIQKKMIRSSSMKIEGKKVKLLIQICKVLEANCYLSAEGSRSYIEENNLFSLNDIRLVYQSYEHPSYQQLHGEFVSHLSILDLLFNEGPSSLSIIRSGETYLK